MKAKRLQFLGSLGSSMFRSTSANPQPDVVPVSMFLPGHTVMEGNYRKVIIFFSCIFKKKSKTNIIKAFPKKACCYVISLLNNSFSAKERILGTT